MSVQLFLDRPSTFFTNLDEITGKVVLRATRPETVNTITVKLEGESRTRLINQGRPGSNDKPRPVLEVHKVCGTDTIKSSDLGHRRPEGRILSERKLTCGSSCTR
jgi:hypothetical protein